MGRKVQSWWRSVPVMDVDDMRFVLVPVRLACSVCVSGSAICVLEGWNLEVCTSLCQCRFLIGRFCYRSSVAERGICPCPVPCFSPGTERACSCPSPKGWYRASRAQSLGLSRLFLVGSCSCCSVDLVAWGVGFNRGGGLCLPWMWMMCGVSMFPSLRLAAVTVCLRVGCSCV